MLDRTNFQQLAAAGPLRIMLLLPSLHGGGAERVAVDLASRLDPSRFDVKIGLLRRAGPYLADVDPSKIVTPSDGDDWLRDDRTNAEQYRPSAMLASIVRGPRGVAEMVRAHRPEVVVSFLKGMSIATKFGLQRLSPAERPVWIAREGNNTDAVIDDELPNAIARAVMKRLIRHVYRSADHVLANSADMIATLQPALGLDPAKVTAIHNPIDVTRIAALAGEPIADGPLAGGASRPFIVTAGRLEHQKAHDVLIRAFAAAPAAKDMDLVILGRGSLEAQTRQLAQDLGVGDRVHLPGFVANPWSYFSRARLFALSSRWEGCCSAVGEALACGAPTLVTNCAFGPRELVEHGKSGWIVGYDDVAALSTAMDMLLSDEALSARLGAAARVRALEFNIDRTVAAYARLLMEVAPRQQALALAA